MEPISGKMDKKVVFSTCCGMKLYAVIAPSEKEHCCEAVNCGSVHHLGCEAILVSNSINGWLRSSGDGAGHENFYVVAVRGAVTRRASVSFCRRRNPGPFYRSPPNKCSLNYCPAFAECR